jgi:hypothetical protein
VGRGIHLILPRERLLAVRFICSDSYRIKRLSKFLDAEEKEVEIILQQVDKEQRDFFKRAFGQKDITPDEFDLVINRNYITEPETAAEIVAQAFKLKFAAEIGEEKDSTSAAA